jgi:hypothetical protein
MLGFVDCPRGHGVCGECRSVGSAYWSRCQGVAPRCAPKYWYWYAVACCQSEGVVTLHSKVHAVPDDIDDVLNSHKQVVLTCIEHRGPSSGLAHAHHPAVLRLLLRPPSCGRVELVPRGTVPHRCERGAERVECQHAAARRGRTLVVYDQYSICIACICIV